MDSLQKKCRAEHILLALAALLLLLFALAELGYHVGGFFSHAAILWRTAVLCGICSLFLLGARMAVKRTEKAAYMRHTLLLCFFLYLYLILTFTLTDASLGRGRFEGYANGRAYYMEHYVNAVPLRSIYTVYIRGFINGYVNSFYMLLNLLGNLCAFMPFAFFLPLLWRPMRRWYLFFPVLLGVVALIELLQLLLMVGSCDIDDLILNAGGAMPFYALLRLSPVKRLVSRLTLLQ